MKTHYEETPYGFEFGAAKVSRVASHEGYVVLAIDTDYKTLHIHVSPKGRSIKVEEINQ